MISQLLTIGTKGLLEIRDNTDSDLNTVELWISATEELIIPDIIWDYKVDGAPTDLQPFDYQPVTTPQHVATIYVGYLAEDFLWHLEDTMTAELGGAVDFEIGLFRASETKTVLINVDDVWKQAVPYVNDEGTWKPAVGYVKVSGYWKST